MNAKSRKRKSLFAVPLKPLIKATRLLSLALLVSVDGRAKD
jgi:hypothetical protein